MGEQQSMPASYQVKPINSDHTGLDRLLALSDQLMFSLYPAEHCFLEDAEALNQNNVRLLGILHDDDLVGMGAVKLLNHDKPYGEIKRVFIEPTHRGKGLSSFLMQKLETITINAGILCLRLETGPKQPEALKLYNKLGYRERGPFGDYQDAEDSIFMEKELIS